MKAITLIYLIIFQVLPLNAYADCDPISAKLHTIEEGKCETKSKACANALNACIDYTKKEALDIDYAKQEIQALENQMVTDDNRATRNTLLYTIIGFLSGGLLVRVLTK
jgi:hypothetical protein